MRRSRGMGTLIPFIIVITAVLIIMGVLSNFGGEASVGLTFSGDYSGIFFTFFVFLLICAVVNVMLNRGDKRRRRSMEAFLTKEREANSSRKQDIAGDMFVETRVPCEAYVSRDVGGVSLLNKQQKASEAAETPMLKLKMTNTEIKLNFGPQNVDVVMLYEENFNKYVRTLLEWAEELAKADMKKEAVVVLEEAVRIGADNSKVYIVLADLYNELGLRDGIDNLKQQLEKINFGSFDNIAKGKIRSYIGCIGEQEGRA